MQLDSYTTSSSKGHVLSFKPSPYFIIQVCLGHKNYIVSISVLLDFEASAFFLDERFAKRHKISLM